MIFNDITTHVPIDHCFLHLSMVGMVFLLLFESNDVVVKDYLSYTPWQSQLLSWWAYEGSGFTPAAAVGRIGHGIVLLPPYYCNNNKMGNYYPNVTTTCDRITNLENRRGTVQSVGFIAAAVVLMVLCVVHFLKQWKQRNKMKRSSNSQRKTTESKGHHHDAQKPVDVGTTKHRRKKNSKVEERAMSVETKFAAETGTSKTRSSTSSLSSPTQRTYNLRCRPKKSIYKD